MIEILCFKNNRNNNENLCDSTIFITRIIDHPIIFKVIYIKKKKNACNFLVIYLLHMMTISFRFYFDLGNF